MTYSIIVKPACTGRYTLVDKSVHNNSGTWGPSVNGVEVLMMPESGTSGVLRYRNNVGEWFIVVVGIHNYKPWVDIATDLAAHEDTKTVNQEWYGKGKRNQNWVQVIEKQTTSKLGTLVDLRILSQSGNQFNAELNVVDA